MIGGSTRCPLLVRGRSFVERNGRCRPVWLVGCGGNFYRRLIWLTGGWRTLCRGRTWVRGCGRKCPRPRTRQRWWGCPPRLAAPTGCELTEPAEKTLRNSRSRRFAHCRWLRLWRLRLERKAPVCRRHAARPFCLPDARVRGIFCRSLPLADSACTL
jgi:hypothetical protein